MNFVSTEILSNVRILLYASKYFAISRFNFKEYADFGHQVEAFTHSLTTLLPIAEKVEEPFL